MHRRRHHIANLDIRYFRRARQQIIGECRRQGLPVFVRNPSPEDAGTSAWRTAACDLRIDDHRIDHIAAILHDRVIDQLDRAGLGIDQNDRRMGRVREYTGRFTRLISLGRIQNWIDLGWTLSQVMAARPTMDYDGRYGADQGPWTTKMFIEAVYRDLSG